MAGAATAATTIPVIPSISMKEIEEINEDTVTDKTIKALLQKEIDLQLEIEAVQSEIKVLEQGTNVKDGEEDSEEQGNL